MISVLKGGFVICLELLGRAGVETFMINTPSQLNLMKIEMGAMACCRFHGHRVKVFPMKLERRNATKEVQPRI